MSYPIVNTRKTVTYERVGKAGRLSEQDGRWIGRCKRCGASHKLEGRVMQGWNRSDSGNSDYVIQESGTGAIYTAQSPFEVVVPCGDHWCRVQRVTEGTKNSKHECGARCTSATGPNCDCRCRGKNHGSNL